MKKLMKAIAFATVMCMLLSTAAFAAQEAVVNEAKNGINVTVEATEGTQVALLILAKGTKLEDAASGNILFIDQKPAAAAGIATFANVSIGTAKSADVFVGYEGNETVALGTVTFEAGDTIEVKTLALYQNLAGEEANNDLGGGFVVDFTANLDEGRTISKLIWAVDWEKLVDDVKVGDGTSYIVADDMIEDINYLSGTTRFGVAFAAGAKKWGKHTVDLGTVPEGGSTEIIRAIVKTTGAGENALPDKEIVSEKDKANNPKYN